MKVKYVLEPLWKFKPNPGDISEEVRVTVKNNAGNPVCLIRKLDISKEKGFRQWFCTKPLACCKLMFPNTSYMPSDK